MNAYLINKEDVSKCIDLHTDGMYFPSFRAASMTEGKKHDKFIVWKDSQVSI